MVSTTSTESTTDSNTTIQPTFPNDYLNHKLHPPVGVQNTSGYMSTKMHEPTTAIITIVCTLSAFLIVEIIVVLAIIIAVCRYKARRCHSIDNADKMEKEYPSHLHRPEVQLSDTNTLNPHTIDIQTSEDKQHNHKVLVIYSINTPKEKKESIRHDLIVELDSFGIETISHEFACIKESVPLWLETEIKKATAVLCVCNKEFQEEWEGTNSNFMSSLRLVEPLKHCISATVQGGDFSKKFAVVLLEPCDKQYIPTIYLHDCRQFMVTEADALARFVCNIPCYLTS